MNEIYSIKARWMLDGELRTLENRHIIVENGKIGYVGNYDSSRIARDVEHIHYSHGLVVPPFINSHTHIAETLIRGLSDDTDLHDWLYNHVWVVEPKMKAVDARIGTQLAVAEMLRGGTIGFHDQFYYSGEIAQVVKETGVKAHINPSIFENNPETKTSRAAINMNLKILKKWHGFEDRIFIGFGPHAPYSVPDELFVEIHEHAEKYDTTIHTHLHETKREVRDAVEKNNMTPIQSLHKLGVLDRVNAAHCIYLEHRDIELLKSNSVPILHNIQSNLKIGAGIADIPKLLEEGLTICLGTDGNGSNNNLDMLEEIRLTALIHKGMHKDPKLINARQALRLGTQTAGTLFPKESYTGRIEENNPADLVIVDLNRVNTRPVINPLSNWVFAASSDNVVTTMSNGRILYRDGNYLTLDVDEVLERAQKSTERMMSEAGLTPYEFSQDDT